MQPAAYNDPYERIEELEAALIAQSTRVAELERKNTTLALLRIEMEPELATLRGQVEAVRALVQDPSDKWPDLEEEDYDADGMDRWIYKATVRAALAPAPDEVKG